MEWVRTQRRGTHVLAALVLLATLWWPFLLGQRVPILGFVDLAIHEAGHLFFLWAPDDVMLVMGNGFQALVPLVFAASFVVQQRDLAGGAAALGWCGAALQDASVYIADAPFRRLPLLGPEEFHDWWQLLGRHGWLEAADELSRVVWVVGLLVWLAGVALLAVGARWDDEWRGGARGTVYLPWEREVARGTVVWPDRAGPADRGGGSGPGPGAAPDGWDDVPWGTGRPAPPPRGGHAPEE